MGKENQNMYKVDFTNYLLSILDKLDKILNYITQE